MKILACTFLFLSWIHVCNKAPDKQSFRSAVQIPFSTDTFASLNFNENLIAQNLQQEGKDTIISGYLIGKFNGVDIALSMKSDTAQLFQKLHSKWTLTDTLDIGTSMSVQKTDLNGDKVQDLYLVTNINASGNLETVVLIFSTTKNRFVHLPEFDLPNIEYDSISGMVRSSWQGRGGTKWLYKPINEHLVFQEGIGLIEAEKSWILEYYTQGSGPQKAYKTRKGHLEKLASIFEMALWDTSKK